MDWDFPEGIAPHRQILKKAAVEKGFDDPYEFAAAANINSTTLKRIVTGETLKPHKETAEKLSVAAEVPVCWLLPDVYPWKPNEFLYKLGIRERCPDLDAKCSGPVVGELCVVSDKHNFEQEILTLNLADPLDFLLYERLEKIRGTQPRGWIDHSLRAYQHSGDWSFLLGGGKALIYSRNHNRFLREEPYRSWMSEQDLSELGFDESKGVNGYCKKVPLILYEYASVDSHLHGTYSKLGARVFKH